MLLRRDNSADNDEIRIQHHALKTDLAEENRLSIGLADGKQGEHRCRHRAGDCELHWYGLFCKVFKPPTGAHPTRSVRDAALRIRRVGGYRVILQFGSAHWSLATPASVTCVLWKFNISSRVSPLKFSSPASVTCGIVPRNKYLSCVNPLRCSSPLSVTRELPRYNSRSLLQPSKMCQPRICDLQII